MKCGSTKDYKKHVAAHAAHAALAAHPPQNNEPRLANPIAMRDYNAMAIIRAQKQRQEQQKQKLKREEKQEEQEEQEEKQEKQEKREQVTVSQLSDGSVQIDRSTKLKITIEVEKHETIILRALDAREAITDAMLSNAMMSLNNQELDEDRLRSQVTTLLYNALRQNDPRLHNVCLSDVSRGTVRVYERAIDTDLCAWEMHPKNVANRIINEYAKNLCEFVLEVGTQSLVPAMWGKIPCLALNGDQLNSIIFYEDWDKTLFVQQTAHGGVSFNPTQANHAKLMELVQTRKAEILQLLRKLVIHQGDITRCLEECRRFCYATMQRTITAP